MLSSLSIGLVWLAATTSVHAASAGSFDDGGDTLVSAMMVRITLRCV